MTTLLDLIDQVTNEAIDRVDRNADPDWKEHALTVVEQLAMTRATFTTDDVWARLDPAFATHEPRALGAVMRKAAALGLIRATSTYENSTRVECHGRPVRVWESAC